MNTSKISELSSVNTLTNNDILPIVNEGDTKQVSIEKLQDILASKQYVDNALSNVTITLDNTVTETSENGVKSSGIYLALSEKQDALTAGDNISIVDNVISSTGGGSTSNLYLVNSMVTEGHEKVKNYITDIMNGINSTLIMYDEGWDRRPAGYYYLRGIEIYAKSCTLRFNGVNNKTTGTNYGNSYNIINCAMYVFTYDSPTGTYTYGGGSFLTYNEYTSLNVLGTSNTTAYTPTGNYNPATKKYVDDQVGSINTVLATLTTVGEE